MKLTTQQIQQIIKEELNRVLYEAKGIDVISLPRKIINALRSKKLEPLDYARINHLFKLFMKGDKSDSEFAKKWIKSLYKEFPEFKKIVDNDFALTYALNPSSEFVSTQKDISDTSNTPTGITAHDFDPYLFYKRFKGKNLAGRDFTYGPRGGSGRDFRHLDLTGANLSGAKMMSANLSGVNLSGADLSGADLIVANLERANLLDADLSGADLRHANLIKANLSGANLFQVQLFNADLMGANLSGANLRRASFSRASYDDRTRWPEGFDPQEHGMIKK